MRSTWGLLYVLKNGSQIKTKQTAGENSSGFTTKLSPQGGPLSGDLLDQNTKSKGAIVRLSDNSSLNLFNATSSIQVFSSPQLNPYQSQLIVYLISKVHPDFKRALYPRKTKI